MIDENEKILKLSIPNNFNIVIFTQNSLRHKRFALRLQQEFGNKVVAWFEIIPNKNKKNLEDSNRQKLFNKIKKHFANIKSIILRTKKTIVYKPSFGLMKYLSLISHRVNNLFLGVSAIWQFYFISRKFNSIERSILYDEINELERFKIIDPELITDPTSDKFIEKVKNLSPYFLLSLGGPLIKSEILGIVKGLSINQHAGWAPDFKGNGTVYWALYHRDLKRLGATVHITSAHADAGAILRRGYPLISTNDTPESCFIRTVVLGTELLIEVVKDAISNGFVSVVEQKKEDGFTYLNKQFNIELYKIIKRDFNKKWLDYELARMREF